MENEQVVGLLSARQDTFWSSAGILGLLSYIGTVVMISVFMQTQQNQNVCGGVLWPSL